MTTIKPTQRDREAAASGYYAWCSGNPVIPNRILGGDADDHSMVQAFARHRIAAEQRGKLEGARLALEAETRFYLDCEFDGHNGPLLSIALVKEDGVSIHIRTDAEPRDPWVMANVMPLMRSHNATKDAWAEIDEVGNAIRDFIGDCACPVIIADSPVDIGRFCRALSTGSDGEWASADYPAMRFEVHNVNCYPTDLPGAVQHNAWWDAMALRRALDPAKIVDLA